MKEALLNVPDKSIQAALLQQLYGLNSASTRLVY